MEQREITPAACLSAHRGRRGPARRGDAILLVLALAGWVASSGAEDKAPNDRSPDDSTARRGLVEEQLGVRVEGLHLSSAGYMIDFRYRVLDPVKAAPLLDRKLSPYLLDESTGARLGVPDAPKVGQLRPTSRNKIIPGRNYFILFANPGRYLRPGSRVSLVAGDTRISHLTVD
jgi:hypothetical protein